jgi:predicted component of type VI protein secretion system
VRAAAGDTETAPETTIPSIGAALANVCDNASTQGAMQELMDKLCSGGGLAAVNPLAACGIEAGAFRDLLAPVMADLEPLLDELKAVVAEFEPRIRAVTDDPATKAKIEAALPQLRERIEGLADPANQPDLSDPVARQKLVDDIKAALAPLSNDAELEAKFEAIANDLRPRLENLADTPEAQALKDKLEGLESNADLRAQAEALMEKLAACKPR